MNVAPEVRHEMRGKKHNNIFVAYIQSIKLTSNIVRDIELFTEDVKSRDKIVFTHNS